MALKEGLINQTNQDAQNKVNQPICDFAEPLLSLGL